jgi:molybdenum cofactor cytidylyltransferase
MGAPKQLLRLNGKSLLRGAGERALESGLGPVVVVLGAGADRLTGELEGLSLERVRNDDWEAGIGSSIFFGVERLKKLASPVQAAILMLCDQPRVNAETLRRLAARYRASGKPLVASAYQGTLGVPALFDRTLFERLQRLDPRAGAKQVIAQCADVVSEPVPEAATDIDTFEDFERERKREVSI